MLQPRPSRRLRGPEAGADVRRPAAACRARPGAGLRSAGASDGRAAVGARQEAARGNPVSRSAASIRKPKSPSSTSPTIRKRRLRLSDRIAVFSKGVIDQIGTGPRALCQSCYPFRGGIHRRQRFHQMRSCGSHQWRNGRLFRLGGETVVTGIFRFTERHCRAESGSSCLRRSASLIRRELRAIGRAGIAGNCQRHHLPRQQHPCGCGNRANERHLPCAFRSARSNLRADRRRKSLHHLGSGAAHVFCD